MGLVIKRTRAISSLIGTDQSVELLGTGNTEAGQDGNFRTVVQSGKMLTQKLISGTWTTLKSLS